MTEGISKLKMGVSTELRDCEKEAGTVRSGCGDVVGQKLTGAKRRERGNEGMREWGKWGKWDDC